MNQKILPIILLIIAIVVFGIYFWKMFVGLILFITILFLGYKVLFDNKTGGKL